MFFPNGVNMEAVTGIKLEIGFSVKPFVLYSPKVAYGSDRSAIGFLQVAILKR